MSKSIFSKSSISIHLIWPIVAIGLILVLRTAAGNSTNQVGEKIYHNYCASCHGKAGEGYADFIPPLAGADYLLTHQAELPCIILHGLEGPIEVNGKLYDQPMAGIGFNELGRAALSPSQIQHLINYIQSNWGNDVPAVTRQNVNDWLEDCK